MQRAHEVLKSVFGFHSFRFEQERAIEALLDGQDVLLLMPTGGGKSLTYQIPAIVMDGCGVVVSPLIALMQDQVESLKQFGVRAACLNSTMDMQAATQVYDDLAAGELDLLFIAPERLMTSYTMGQLARAKLCLFAIDEAHCVSQWGHDFRREYRQLSVLKERFPSVPRIAVTATADVRTRKEIISELALEDGVHLVSSFDRPNINYTISENNSREALWHFISRNHAKDAGIVYCQSRKRTEDIAAYLDKKGRTALAYHAGLDAGTRADVQRRFNKEEGLIIVATVAFGMGIDKPDVRFVAHMNLPKSIEAYYQETGRAGRDGGPANAWMAYGLQDVIQLRNWLMESSAGEEYKRVQHQNLEAFLGLCEQAGCRRQSLLGYFGEKLPEPCGNCDNCQHPPEVYAGKEDAQKLLSCIYRTGQQYGVNYVVDVLRGKEDDRILRNGHNGLSTFGIGKHHSVAHWRSVVRQLMAVGYIWANPEEYGAVKLLDACRPVLRGEKDVSLRIPTKPAYSETSSGRSSRARADFEFDSDEERNLFEALRALRKELATDQNVPPYVIFPDVTLYEMVVTRPSNAAKFLSLNGVGEKKLDRYGADFMAAISEFGELKKAG